MKKTIITLLTLASLIITPTIQAQGKDIDLEINPGVIFLSVRPGQKATHTILLKQNGSTSLTIIPNIVDFQSDGKTGIPILADSTKVNFITIQDPDKKIGQPFNLEPGSSTKIVFNIQPPDDLPEKEYTLSLLFRAQPTNGQSPSDTTITNAVIGANLILHVSSDTSPQSKLEVARLLINQFVDSFRPLKYQLLIENKGENAGPIDGNLKIYNWKNEQVQEYNLAPDLILAHSTRLARFAVDDKKVIDSSSYSSNFSYSSPFLLGPYVIEVTLNDPQKNIENAYVFRHSVFAFPFSVVIIIFIIINTYLGYRYLVAKRSHLAK